MEKEVHATILENLELVASLEESFHEKVAAVTPERSKIGLQQSITSLYKSSFSSITIPHGKQSNSAKLYMPISKESYMARLKTFSISFFIYIKNILLLLINKIIL